MMINRRSFRYTIISLLLSLTVFSIAGADQITSEDPQIVSFGTGSIRVRLYTDYFCGPCSRMEPKIEALLADLVTRNVVTVTFIDTPVHKITPLYAKYFLYIANANRSFKGILRSRAVLFSAAKEKLEDQDALQDYLRKHKVMLKEMDTKPIFVALSALMDQDEIKSTPTCVIIRDGRKNAFSGESEITKALQSLG